MSAVLILIPFFLGALTVVQAGLNNQQSQILGLNKVVIINTCVVLACALISYFLFQDRKDPPNSGAAVSWAALVIAGMIGFSIVIGGPWSVAQWGAVRTFVLFVGAQLLSSLAWDYFANDMRPSLTKLLGLGLTWLGVFISTR